MNPMCTNTLLNHSFYAALVDTPFDIIDRTYLPFEEKIAQLSQLEEHLFTPPECEARVLAIKAMFPRFDALAKDFPDWATRIASGCQGHAVYATQKNGLTEKCKTLGVELLGKKFYAYAQKIDTSLGAVIAPSSPYLSRDDYWRTHLFGIPIEREYGKLFEEITILHEIGHILFPFNNEEKLDPEIHYISEVLPDLWALKTHLEQGDNKANVSLFVANRTLGAFGGCENTLHWTSEACDAFLSNKEQPAFTDATRTISALQVRTAVELNRISPDEATLWEQQITEKANAPIRPKQNVPYCIFEGIPPGKVMRALRKQLCQNKNLPDPERAFGEKVLKAYGLFYPTDAKAIMRSASRHFFMKNAF